MSPEHPGKQSEAGLTSMAEAGIVLPKGITEKSLWLPPARLKAYERNKMAGAVLFVVIFLIFLAIQWSVVWLRFVSFFFIGLTVVITRASIIEERRRATGRQVACFKDRLLIWIGDKSFDFDLNRVARGEYVPPSAEEAAADMTTSGFYFYDEEGTQLGYLDEMLVAEEAEARSFVGWLRDRYQVQFKIDWPQHI